MPKVKTQAKAKGKAPAPPAIEQRKTMLGKASGAQRLARMPMMKSYGPADMVGSAGTGPRAPARAATMRRLQRAVGNTRAFRVTGAYPSSPATSPTRTATIQRRGEAGESEVTSEDLEARLNRIERTYREMVDKAREDGYDVAADNLERFLAGTGGVKTLSVSWLRDFSAITDAERVNQGRFEHTLTDLAYELRDGETRTFTDYWDRQLTASTTTELDYASGTSTIRSTGTFTLSRSGNIITIEGTVRHHWHDPYDWHAGLAAYIPGFGTISDSDALLLQEHRGAGPFDMEADWTQSLSGSVEIVEWWFDKINYDWSGP